MIKKIDHIGIAVNSIKDAVLNYNKLLGIKCEKIENITSQKVETAFFKIDNTHIELLAPTSPDSPIAKFLEKKGEGIHHIAYETDDIEKEIDKALKSGYKVINEKPLVGSGGKKITFIHPKSTNGVLTEFCCKKG